MSFSGSSRLCCEGTATLPSRLLSSFQCSLSSVAVRQHDYLQPQEGCLTTIIDAQLVRRRCDCWPQGWTVRRAAAVNVEPVLSVVLGMLQEGPVKPRAGFASFTCLPSSLPHHRKLNGGTKALEPGQGSSLAQTAVRPLKQKLPDLPQQHTSPQKPSERLPAPDRLPVGQILPSERAKLQLTAPTTATRRLPVQPSALY